MKHFAYSLAWFCLVGAINFQTVKYISRRSFPDAFVKVLSDSMQRFNKFFFEISVIVATNNLINKNNSGSFFLD